MNGGVASSPWLHRGLVPLSLLYAAAIRCWNLYYDRVRSAVRNAGIPVISVGNLTTGGSGKTPLVIELVRRLHALRRHPAVVTRGYAAARGETADEVLELSDALPDVPVVVNPDRVAGAATARHDRGADCIVLDDGFQHRRLARDLDIVVIDALDPWGGGFVLPAGRLREPMTGLRRAGLFVLSRVNQVNESAVEGIRSVLRRVCPHTPILTAPVIVDRLLHAEGRVAEAAALHGAAVLAVCAIGNPATFLRLLDAQGAEVRDRLVLRDHYHYQAADAERIATAAARCNADWVVTTRKDWVKLAPLWRGLSRPVELVRVDVRLALDESTGELDRHLRQAVASSP